MPLPGELDLTRPAVAAAVLMSLAALGGLALFAIRIVRGSNPPRVLVMGHGALVLLGFAALVFGLIHGERPGLVGLGALLFFLVAVAGLWLAWRHRRGLLVPVPMIAIHGAAGLVAVAFYWFLLLET
ncbi:MAG: hypothetical protein AB7T63_03875 [Planctomycetota bacterium]